MGYLWKITFIRNFISRGALKDVFKYDMGKDSCFIGNMGGGRKIPQVWVSNGEKPRMSDPILMRDFSTFALIVVLKKEQAIDDTDIHPFISSANIPARILSAENVVYLRVDGKSNESLLDSKTTESVYWVCDKNMLAQEGITPISGYDATSIKTKIGQSAKYVIVRPDFYIHSVARNENELQSNLSQLAEYFRA